MEVRYQDEAQKISLIGYADTLIVDSQYTKLVGIRKWYQDCLLQSAAEARSRYPHRMVACCAQRSVDDTAKPCPVRAHTQ